MDMFSSTLTNSAAATDLPGVVPKNTGSNTATPIAPLAIADTLDDVTETLGGLLTQFNEVKSTVEDLNNDLRVYLTVLQSGLDTQILARTLPLIGDDLENAAGATVQFLDNLNNQVTAQLLRLDGIGNLSPDTIRQTLLKVLTEQGALALEQLVPASVSEPFVTALQSALTGGAPIEASLRSALETALAELDESGFLNEVLPADLDTLLNAEVVQNTLLKLGETALRELDAAQLQQGLVGAIATLGVANLTAFFPADAVNALQTNVAAALSGGRFSDLETALSEALPALAGQLTAVPTAAAVLAAAGLDATNFNQLGAAGTLQRLFAGLNQLEVLDLDSVLSADELLTTFRGQLAAGNSVPEALNSLLGNVRSTFPDLFSSVPSGAELLTAAVPAFINERLEDLSAEQIAATFSPQQVTPGLLVAVNELALLDLEALIPDGIVGEVIDRFQTRLSEGGTISAALTAGLELALDALNDAGVLPVALPSLADWQQAVLPLINGDQIAALTADQWRGILFAGLANLESLGLPSFVPTAVVSSAASTFAEQLAADASVAAALRGALETALPELAAAGALVDNLPDVEAVLTNVLVPLVADELNELATAPLQAAFLEATNRLGVLNLEQFIPSGEVDVVALFEAVTDRASLESAIAAALDAFDAQNLLADVPNAEAVLNTARFVDLDDADLADLAATDLFGRLFSGLGDLNAFDLDAFIPAAALSGLLETLQTSLSAGADQVAAVQALVEGAIATFQEPNINLFDGDPPELSALLNEFLPEIAGASLADLAINDLGTSLFTALTELEAFNLDRFISLETAQTLLDTFTTELGGDATNIPAALGATLTTALTNSEVLAALAGELPAIDEIVKGLIPEFSSILNGGLGGFLTQIAGIEGITNLDPGAVFQALMTTLTALGGLEALPDLDNDVVDAVARDLVKTFANQLSTGASLTDALVSGLEQAFLALDALEVFPLDIGAAIANFQTELLPRLAAIDLDALSAAEFRSLLVEAAAAFGGLALQTFLPPDIASDLFNLTQTQLQGDTDFTEALQAALDEVLPALQALDILPDLPNSAAVVTQTLLDLGSADLTALAARPLQQALFEAAIAGLDSFDLNAFAPGLTDLFSNVPDGAALAAQVGAALAELESLGLLAATVSVEAVLNAAQLRLGTRELGNLSAAALTERLLTGLNELDALNLDGLLPLDQAQTLIDQFQGQLAAGETLLASLQGLVDEAQTLLDADLFTGGAPAAAELFSALLPELVAEPLQTLTAGTLQNSVLAALNELEALDLSRFLPDAIATDLLATFNQARASGSLSDALQTTLTEAVTQPEFVAAIAGNIPNVDEVLPGFITELTPALDGLSGFLDRILTPPLNGIRTALFQVLGEAGLDLLPDDLPSADDISNQIPKMLLNAALRSFTAGDLAGALQTALTDVLGPLGLGILERGEALAADVQEQILTAVQARLEDPLNGLFGLVGLMDEALDAVLGADVVDVGLADNVLSFDLTVNETTGLDDVALDAAVGLPGLGLETSGSLDLGALFELDLGFNFDLNQRNLFIDTSAANELRLALQATLDELAAKANLGYLQLDVDRNGLPTGLDLGFDIDLTDDGGDQDGQLTLTELGAIALTELVTPKVSGQFDVNLGLETSINGSDLLPAIAANFALAAELDTVDIDDAFDSADIAFNDIQLDLGSFLGGFADTVLGTVQELTQPLQPIIDILNEDVPVIDASFLDLVQNPLFTQVLEEQAAGSVEFVNALLNLIKLLELVNAADGAGQVIDLGSFQVAGVALQDSETGTSSAQLFLLPNSPSGLNFGALALEDDTPAITNPETSPADQLKDSQGELGQNLEANDLFKFPILTDPSAIANLLLGKDDVVLFELTPPPLEVAFEYEQTIPIVGPIAAVVKGGAGAAASVAFGYDSFGLQQFRDSGFTSPGLLAEGLFVTTPLNPEPPFPLPADEPHTVGIGAGIGVGVGVELGVVSADVTAELLGNAFLDLVDPETGEASAVGVKIRIEDLANPGCIFEVSGQIDAALAATLKVGFGPFSYQKRVEILRETLAEGRIDPCHSAAEREDVGQATLEEDGTLVLTTTDDRDQIIVEHLDGALGDETVDVIARIVNADGQTRHVPNDYENVTSILANAQDGDDFIALGEGVLSPATLRGNDGNDNLRGGDGNDTIEGGDDSDVLAGGQGDDTILGGSGDDFISGDRGNDTLDGGESENDFDSVSYASAASGVNISLQPGAVSTDGDGGVDTLANFERIEGSRFADRITGDDDNNTLDGLAGDDVLDGQGGDDFLIGGPGSDVLDGGSEGAEGDAVSYLESVAGVSLNLQTGEVFSGGGSEADGDRLIDIENVQGTVFSDELVGNDKRNRLSGELGDDTIDGGAGADILDGGSGTDELSFQSLNSSVTVSLRAGTATAIEAGQTVTDAIATVDENVSSFENLRGSNFDDDLGGDIRSNEIRGAAGDDILRGDGGGDTLIGGAGADQLDGGAGIDTADYSESSEGVRVEMRGTGSGGDAEGDTFIFKDDTDFATTVENLIGTDFEDALMADGNNNEITPGLSDGGVDFVNGFQGFDRLFIDYSQRDIGQGIQTELNRDGEGTNRLFRLAQDGETILDAVDAVSMEHLTLIGTRQDDQVASEQGDDVLFTGDGDDTIQTGRGSDIVRAGDGDDTVVAQDTDGVLDRQFAGGEAFFFLDGGSGTDTVSLNLSARTEDIVINSPDPAAGEPATTVFLADGSAIANFEIFQDAVLGRGDDQFTQLGRVDNVVDLNVGRNVANLGLGIDQVVGSFDGDDSDTLIIDYSVGDVGGGIQSDTPVDSGFSTGSTGRYFRLDEAGNLLDEIRYDRINVVQIFGTQQADEIMTRNTRGKGLLVGNDGDDTLIELGLRSRLEGGDGNDTLKGGNELFGGDGDDLLDSGRGDDILDGGDGDDILIGTQVIETPSFFFDEDVMTGGAGADEFRLVDLATGQRLYFDQFNQSRDAFARVTDFNRAEGDFLRLQGEPDDYFVQENDDGSTSIFLRSSSDDVFLGDLVVVLAGVDNFSFSQDVVFGPDPVIGIRAQSRQLASPAGGEAAIAPTDGTVLLEVEDTEDSGEMSILPIAEEGTPRQIENIAGNGEVTTQAEANGFVVEQNNDAADLLTQLLGDTTGLSNIRVTTKGDARAFGTFLNDPFGLGAGMVLSTGKVEDIASVNNEDGDLSPGTTVNLTFEKLAGETRPGSVVGVFRADLSTLGLDLSSLSITDSGNQGGGSGLFTGFDLDAIKISNVRIDNAADIENLPSLDVFDFSPLGTILEPGSQRDPNAVPDLGGSINGFVNNEVATLGSFDAIGNDNLAAGALSLGNRGKVSFNLTETLSLNPDEPLFLYIGEAGNNEDAPSGEITVSDRRVGEGGLLSTDFGLPGTEGDTTELIIDFTANDQLRDLIFQFAFGSEEFVEFAGSQFNDIFELELNGFNLARLSDGQAARINALALSPTGQFHPDYVDNAVETGLAREQTGLDGFTDVLTFSGAVKPNAENRLVIRVKDEQDGLLDSAVFLKANTVLSDPIPGVVVLAGDGIAVAEGGKSDTFDVVLSTVPTATVTVTLTPDNQLDLGNGANQPIVLTFTPDTARTAQTVTVAALDDQVFEALHNGVIRFAVSSDDPTYNDVFVPNAIAKITDNEASAAVLVTNADNLQVSEDGLTDTFEIALSTVPTEVVTVTLAADPQLDFGAGVNRSLTLTFTPDNALTPQRVTVAAFDDAVAEGLHTGQLAFTVESDDGVYDGLAIAPQTVRIFDNDPSKVIDVDDLDGTNGFAIPGIDAGDASGSSVSVAGDLNHDGISDVIIGAPRASGDRGESYVVFGREAFPSFVDLTELDGSNGFRLDGIASGDRAGIAVSQVGDVNHDGIDDVMIGARDRTVNGQAKVGESYVVFGRDGNFPAALSLASLDGSNGFAIAGIGARDGAGVTVSGAGDVNNDGIDDLIIGSLSDNRESYVVFGRQNGFASRVNLATLNGANGFKLVGLEAGNVNFDLAVSGAGDVNGDGIGDVIIGNAIAAPNGQTAAGKSFVVFGQAGNRLPAIVNVQQLNGSNGFVLNGIDAGDHAGIAVSGAGDINGDGIADLIIGAPAVGGLEPDDPAPNSGESYVVFGRRDGFAPVLELADLDGSNGFKIQVDAINRRLGSAVSAAGDFNGDGLDDLIVGADEGGTIGGGKSFVIFGQREGFASTFDVFADLDGRNGIQIETGLSDRQLLGSAVSGAGDVNNDGVDDLIVGAPNANPGGKAQAGESYVIFGNAVPVIDLNGDAAGLDQDFTLPVGSGAIALGSDLTVTDTNSPTLSQATIAIINPQAGDREQLTIDTSGTNLEATFQNGTLFLVGTDTVANYQRALQTVTYVNTSAQPDLTPRQIAFSTSDGETFNDRSTPAIATLTFENPSAELDLAELDGTNGFVINGAEAGDLAGRAVSAAGDVNGDGIADLIIGASGAGPAGKPEAGESYLIFGRTNGFSAELDLAQLKRKEGLKIRGIDSGDTAMGIAVSGAGDVNNDGYDDLIIGAPSADPNNRQDGGESYVIWGRSKFPANFPLTKLNGKNGFVLAGFEHEGAVGTAVRGVGDFDGDGYADLLVGANQAYPNGRLNAGESYLIFGDQSGFDADLNLADLDGQNGFAILGAAVGDQAGTAVSGADFNGDGCADLLMGAPLADPNGSEDAGAAYLILGRHDRPLTALDLANLSPSDGITTFNGIDPNDLAGIALSTAGDVNGDGLEDLIIGAKRGDRGDQADAGESYVVFGQDDFSSGSFNLADLDGSNGFVIQGLNAADESGGAVSGVGDLNGDGFGDLLVGAKAADPQGREDAGQSYVIFGQADGFAPTLSLADLNGQNGFVLSGIQAGDGAGGAVSGAGDVNGDGLADLIIGAATADPQGREDAGQSYVVFGNAAPELDLNGELPGRDRASLPAGDGPTRLLNPDDLVLQDANSSHLAQAVITLVNPLDGEAELLSVDTGNTDIVASYDPNQHRLTLTGSDTLEHYRQVLGQITYEHLGDTPTFGERQFEFTVDDGGSFSSVSASAIAFLEIT